MTIQHPRQTNHIPSTATTPSALPPGLCIIPHKLYLSVLTPQQYTHHLPLSHRQPITTPHSHAYTYQHWFTIDHSNLYEPFYTDFGPLKLTIIHNFNALLLSKLNDTEYGECTLHLYISSLNQHDITNTLTLMGCFCVIHLGYTPAYTCQLLQPYIDQYATHYRDASPAHRTQLCHSITVQSLISAAVHKATLFGFYSTTHQHSMY